MMIRDLDSTQVSKIVVIPGIITATSKTTVRARKAVYQCTNCGHEKVMEIPFGLTRAIAPAICEHSKAPGQNKERCPLNSYRMNTDKCEFIDQQIIKL